MTARPGGLQTSWNSGELSPELHGRYDIKQAYSGCALLQGLEPVPQGGFRLMPRSRHLGRFRRVLETVTPASVVIDDGSWSAAGTVVTITLSAPVAVAAVTLDGFYSTVAYEGALQVEWYDGAAASWKPIGSAFGVGTSARLRTAAFPPGLGRTTDQLRVRLAAPPATIDLTIGAVSVRRESATRSARASHAFTFSSTQAYVVNLTDGFADIWRNGVHVGASLVPFTSAQIRLIVSQQRFDTMILYHQDVATQRLMRAGADHEWQLDAWPYQNLPEVDLGGAYTVTNDFWQIYLRYPSSDAYANGVGVVVSLTINGEDTAGIAVGSGPDWGAFVTAMKAAIEALPSVEAGISFSLNASNSDVAIFDLIFSGGGNAGTVFVTSARVVNTPLAAATTVHVTIGERGGEPLASNDRGWPAAGIFYQDRSITGGFKAKKGALLASVTGEYFNNNIEITAATGAPLINLDTDGAEQVHRFFRSKHLVIHTTEAEYFISDRQVTRTQPPNIVESSRYGSRPGVPIVASENSHLFVNSRGSMILSSTYNDVSQSYEAEPFSLLASHLVTDLVGAGLQKGSEETDADRYFAVRGDGMLVVANLIRNQEVAGFGRWVTDGSTFGVCVDGGNVAYVGVTRLVDGAEDDFFERLEPELLLDGAISFTFETEQTIVGGLGIHEGATVWAVTDGYVHGPFTVDGAQITLPYAALAVTVGRWTAPRMRTLPPNREVAQRIVLRRPGRIHTVQMNLIGSTSVAVGANGRPAKNRPLYQGGSAVSTPLVPTTAQIKVTGLKGFTDAPTAEITQTRPGRLQIRDIDVQARL